MQIIPVIDLKNGAVVCQGHPHTVMTPASIQHVFNIDCCVIQHPLGNVPVVQWLPTR